jgi:hypothetical protein
MSQVGSRRLQREMMRQRGDHAAAVRQRHGMTALRILLLESRDPGAEHAATVGLDASEYAAIVTALIDDRDARAYAADALDRPGRQPWPAALTCGATGERIQTIANE